MKPSEENKDEKKKKKKKKDEGSNLTLYIGLGCGGLALIVMCAGGVVGGVGYQQGWFSSKKETQVVKDGKAKTDGDNRKTGDNNPKTDDGKANPGDQKTKGNDDKKKNEKAPGVVNFIPKNFTNNFKFKNEPNPTTLAEVEKKLGAPGKKLAPNEIDPEFASLLQQAQATGATTYQWTAGRDKLFLAFDGNIWAGCMLFKNK